MFVWIQYFQVEFGVHQLINEERYGYDWIMEYNFVGLLFWNNIKTKEDTWAVNVTSR